ncbi:GNAT family N-acetyltransferase [Altererythrobacter luteolus]|uniref:GNAT family N-acetyltransferase n=1 Tax=Pontixanthobacter luteolus TaxID=295089 RepID=A0A6I4UY71_9SPHN|nr:GNAT family N-acetyltransferase [Pontixanthobacter luteolus]MXP46899.1 GNAT family N-acetyltransferase [Pontixanthobacter luteolus]
MKVSIELDLDRERAQQLSEGIVEFNRAAVPDLEPNEAETQFHVLAQDAAGNVAGGLRATCYWNTLHIELLWLSDTARGTGIGRELVEKAEEFAISQNCRKALVETTSWQARPFYEKLGYTHMATLHDRPKGHASHYLSKTLEMD